MTYDEKMKLLIDDRYPLPRNIARSGYMKIKWAASAFGWRSRSLALWI